MGSDVTLWLLPLLAAPLIGIFLWVRISHLNFRPFCSPETRNRFLGICALSWLVDLAIALLSSPVKFGSTPVAPFGSGTLGLAASGGYIFWSDKKQAKFNDGDQAALFRLAVSFGARQLSRLYTELSIAKGERCTEIDEKIRAAYAIKYSDNGFSNALKEVYEYMDSLVRMYPDKDERQDRSNALSAARDMARKKSSLSYLIEVAYGWGIEDRVLDKFS